ncbi:GyrI-like domain-containing protein [Acidipropionibacterium timonense]|uniref:GyrI-like domain-containing protein n=1 Tax=Acidipropionibacterium timonense TaxID=2161818 RepID=UPI00103136D7|nr:GyrI-like domain-containing protein [Acidipropionibacterium timonense]
MTHKEPRRRAVPNQDVLAVSRRISVDELDEFIDTTMRTLERMAPPAGHPFVVYHDGLTVGSPGTVEVCQPVHARRLDPPEGVVRRVEPAHVEAWVTVSRAELAFPEIDDIYADLDADLRSRGWQRNGAPREVYWGSWNDAAIDDPTCDVCFPVVPHPDEM